MPKAARKHLGPHKYLRIKYKRKDGTEWIVFKCQLPHCTTHKPAALLIGDFCECWVCGRAFQMTKRTLQLKKPHCVICTGTSNAHLKRAKKPVDLKKVEDKLDELLGGSLDDLLGGN
jgi:hypothetical protein